MRFDVLKTVAAVIATALMALPGGAAAQAQPGGDAAKRQALLAAYPGLFAFDGNAIVWDDGTRMVWDDGAVRSPAELIADPDIEDMFAYAYPLAAAAGDLAPQPDSDPGRIRNEAFFKQLYGASAGAVESQLTTLDWAGSDTMRVTTALGVAQRLEAVVAELEALGPAYQKYLVAPGGGFSWRTIAGTSQLSVHAFGAAVDINTGHADYWRWSEAVNGGPVAFKSRIPLQIVAIFETYGFIWGGRWYHYDTMHFEFRPELLNHAQVR